MLSVKNISKTYTPKKGVPVKAVDNVSLDFDEKGLVFILGKSGSGKSTLLNLIGGLDSADSGEFSLYNKSTKDFTQSDFDAYRNTYIGFIFQEYNILKEFTVGQNIALAMELQGKKATNEMLNKILKDVDLEGYAIRKPNELSGGQKQRVAIARALIKDPKIIMADEPTGALDSNTGRQVFDTLKRLSKEKLVIVVSHDREFAEDYGDRVIELADGKVISDITKYEQEIIDVEEKETVTEDSFPLKSGYTLTEEDLRLIREYINKQIEKGILDKENPQGKGKKYAFNNTVIESKDYQNKEVNLIKSKFPYKDSLRIGASSLRVKPFRLIFTILLSFISFAMFGLTDTFAAYNKYSAATQSILDTGVQTAMMEVKERHFYNNIGVEMYSSGTVGDETLSELKEKSGLDFCPVYYGTDTYKQMRLPTNSIGEYVYYKNTCGGIAEVRQDKLSDFNSEIYKGRMPENYDEVAITKYMYEVFKHCGIVTENGIILSHNLTDDDNESTGILGKQIKITDNSNNSLLLKIVGIIDTHMSDKFNDLKTEIKDEMTMYFSKANRELNEAILNDIHGMLIVADGSINRLIKESNIVDKKASFTLVKDGNQGVNFNTMTKLKELGGQDIVWTGDEKSVLSDNEVILPYSAFSDCFSRIKDITLYCYSDEWDDAEEFYSKKNVTYNNYYVMNEETIWHVVLDEVYKNGVPSSFIEYKQLQNATKKEQIDQYYFELYNNWHNNENTNWKIAQAKFLLNAMQDNSVNISDYKIANLRREYKEVDINIVGFYDFSTKESSYRRNKICLSDSLYDMFDYGEENYNRFIAPMPTGATAVRKLINLSYDYNYHNGDKIQLNNLVVNLIEGVDETVKVLAFIFVFIGLGMAIFSGLLLANFIAVSISNKKQEIGILRALGAKSSDVFMIFFNESMIIAIINYIVSVIGTAICIFFINRYFRTGYNMQLTLLVFGIRQLAIMLAISVFVALAASFFPVRAIARKQPIDSIQER